MKVKIIINPEFEILRSYINSIADYSANLGEPIYAGRNTVYRHTIEGIDITTKSFRTPILINRIIYTFFRKTKARRSFENASRLIEMGIGTPTPIAYIEIYEGGLLSRSYYICLYIKDAFDIRWWEGRKNKDEIIDHTASAMALIHSKGVFHKDFSPGNLLFDKDWSFYIIDLNRMLFDVKDSKVFMENFSRLNDFPNEIEALAHKYYQISPFPDLTEEQIVSLALKAHHRFWHRKKIHNKLKRRK